MLTFYLCGLKSGPKVAGTSVNTGPKGLTDNDMLSGLKAYTTCLRVSYCSDETP